MEKSLSDTGQVMEIAEEALAQGADCVRTGPSASK